MKWDTLIEMDQLELIRQTSAEKSVLVFKHSTRCSTSRMVLDRLERNWKEDEMKNVRFFFLDLIAHRDISNAIATNFEVPHESPQVLIIKNGKSVYDFSHLEIDYHHIAKLIK